MHKIFSIIIVLFLFSNFAFGQEQIDWLTWEEAMEKSKTEKRKFVVDIFTEWCGWCKKMDKSTFSNPEIVAYVNEHYYPIKFDLEYKEDINFNGKVYKFVSGGRNGYHELGAEIMKGKMSLPTVVFLNEEATVIQPIPGFQDISTFKMIMNYFAGDHFKNTPWPRYTRTFEMQALPVKN